jgi:hypothetical protein
MSLLLFVRNRISTVIVMYSLYLYFLGFRNTSRALSIFKDEKRSYVSVWNWIQRFDSCTIYKHKRVSAFILDETMIQVGTNITGCGFVLNQYINLFLELISPTPEICLFYPHFWNLWLVNMVDIRSIQMVLLGIQKHVRHRLKHYLYSSVEKSLIDRKGYAVL